MVNPEEATSGPGGNGQTPRRANQEGEGAPANPEAGGAGAAAAVFDPVARLADAIECLIVELLDSDDSPPPSPPPGEAPMANPPTVAAPLPSPSSSPELPDRKSKQKTRTRPKQTGSAVGQGKERPNPTGPTAPLPQPHPADCPTGIIPGTRRRIFRDWGVEEPVRNGDILARHLEPEVRNIESESPPDKLLSSDAETVNAVQDDRPDVVSSDENEQKPPAMRNPSPGMQRFFDSLQTQRRLRRLSSHNDPGQNESNDVMRPSRLRSNIDTVRSQNQQQRHDET